MKKLLFISLFALPLMLNAQVFNASSMRMPASGPTITLNPIFVNNFSNVTGTASSAQTTTVSWFNLSANISIGSLANFEYSYDGTTYSSSLSIPKGTGNGDTLIYIRGTAAAATGTHSGNVAFSSTGATTINLAVTCVVSASGTAAITRLPTTVDLGTTVVGSPGSPANSTINGSNLSVGITVTAGAGSEISVDNGLTYHSSGTISQSGGSVTNFILYIRLTGASIGNPSGNVSLASTGATTMNIAYSGTVTAGGTAVDSIVARINFCATAQSIAFWTDFVGNPALSALTVTDFTNYQPVVFASVLGGWIGIGSPNHSSSNTTGTGGSTVMPDGVGISNWWDFHSSWTGATISDTNLIISNLDPTKVYSFDILCSRSGQGCSNVYSTVSVFDSTNNRKDSATIDMKNNTGTLIHFQNKVPDAGGVIRLAVKPWAGGTAGNCSNFGWINGLIATKQVGRE